MNNPLQPTHRFILNIQGIAEAGFTEVSGLSDEVEMESIPEGGQNGYLLQTPSRMRHQRLVLKRGIINAQLRVWFDKFRKKHIVDRRNIDIFQIGRNGRPVFQWMFRNAFPVKWNGPVLNSMSSVVAFESIEMVHHGMEMMRL